MLLRLGELYHCADLGCGFEVLVYHDAPDPQERPSPICCCGSPMRVVG